VVSAVIGEGGSGGALACLADRVLMQEHAWYSVISPEGLRVDPLSRAHARDGGGSGGCCA